MARFDDARENLHWMEEALLAEEEEYEDEYGEDYDEDEDWDEEYEEEEEPPARNAFHSRRRRKNPAVDFHRTVYADEEFDEDSALLTEDMPRKKGIGGLVFLAILEIIAILAIVRWWLQWLI